MTVFDPAAEWTVDPRAFRSKGRNSPYAGMTLTGRVHYALVGGEVAYDIRGGTPS